MQPRICRGSEHTKPFRGSGTKQALSTACLPPRASGREASPLSAGELSPPALVRLGTSSLMTSNCLGTQTSFLFESKHGEWQHSFSAGYPTQTQTVSHVLQKRDVNLERKKPRQTVPANHSCLVWGSECAAESQHRSEQTFRNGGGSPGT